MSSLVHCWDSYSPWNGGVRRIMLVIITCTAYIGLAWRLRLHAALHLLAFDFPSRYRNGHEGRTFRNRHWRHFPGTFDFVPPVHLLMGVPGHNHSIGIVVHSIGSETPFRTPGLTMYSERHS